MVINWRNLTIELVEELYTARNELSRPGARNDLTLSQMERGWNGYLEDIGLPRTTVHRWLERYEPEERRLLEPEELEERKQIETRKKQFESTAIQKRIAEYKRTNIKPKDWDEKTEREYLKVIQEDKARKQRIDEYKKQSEEAQEKKRIEEEQIREQRIRRDIESEMLKSMTDLHLKNFEKKQAFKKRIKLSQSGESDLFIEALMDYLNELPDDNRRIEACNNIIKVCRNISVELQRGQ